MKFLRYLIAGVTFALFSLLPSGVFAVTHSFEISGWIPYWRSEKGVENTIPNLTILTSVHPFMYSVKSDGTIRAESSLEKAEWVRLRVEAKNRNVQIIPTLLWNDGSATHTILSNQENRSRHIANIISEVNQYSLDGIDIDYEGKRAETRPFFSLFLKELKEALGKKTLTCTIEARTPLIDRYSKPEAIPADIEYANEYKDINLYCDRVRIMAYDQGRIDLTLNKQNVGPYIPVSDIAWAEKVIRLALEDISADKLILGIPTYGYEYDMTFGSIGSVISYSRVTSFNPEYARTLASILKKTPTRNSAGELFLIYATSELPDYTPLMPATARILSWGDADSAKQKIDLARKLGLRGVSIFKFDGEQDPRLWSTLKTASEQTVSVVASYGDLFTGSDLQYGMRTDRVKLLQAYLNDQGFMVATAGGGSKGNETIFFGPATRSALIRYQKARSITPAVGYFGPITRHTAQGL